MTIKEITALRKSGHLQEALEAAEKEYGGNANKYTAGALFWCLNDLVRTQNGEDAESIIERMKPLYAKYCEGDEYMQHALASITRRAQPHYQDLKDAIERAKTGSNVASDYRAMAAIYEAEELEASLFPDFGWLIYYALKQTPLSEAHTRKLMLNNYLKLDLQKPSILHSLILAEAIKVEQNTPLQFRIRDFIRMWGLENLRDEDWIQYRKDDGNTLPSTVEKLIGVYAKELKTDRVAAPEEFCRLVDKALDEYPKSQNMPYFKATVLLSLGKHDEALPYYKDLILRFPSKFYLWNQTAELVEDEDTKIGLICKALTSGTEDEFLGGVRLKLATMLIQKNLMANAKYELERYRQTYQKNGWNLKPEYWQIFTPLAAIEPAETNDSVYAEFASKAEEFIYSSLPTLLAVKVTESLTDDRNHPGRKILTWILRTGESAERLRKPTKFGLNKRTSNGAVFDVKMRDGKIVWIKEHKDAVVLPWLKEQRGEVRLRTDRNGKKFAIVSGTYAGESLLKGICEGEEVKILAAQQKDGRWSAISLSKM